MLNGYNQCSSTDRFNIFGFDTQVANFLNLQNKLETKKNFNFVFDQSKIVKNAFLLQKILKIINECVKN